MYYQLLSVLVTLSLWSVFGLAAGPAEAGGQDGPTQWERVGRTDVHRGERRTSYPSITKAADGSLLVLFASQNAEQEKAGTGDLLLVSSSDAGKTWSQSRVVVQGKGCEPRAAGTLTTLKDGRIMAPFAEFRDAQATSTVRILTSNDDGKHWQVSDATVSIPLAWWTPCGKVIETAAGALVMPVYGALSEADLKATIHNCGLLRSNDGGKTWGDFIWLAKGRGAVVGAAPTIRFSFEGPVLQPLANGRWLAMITARRLNRAGDGPTKSNEGPGSPLVLCRAWSSDEGRTWTAPDQLTPGAWPALAVAGKQTLCVNTTWAACGSMRLMASRDGFNTFFQQANIFERGWLRGQLNKPQEAPLPPTVPFLADQWEYEHYGFPSVLALDEDHLILVFGRTQQGSAPYLYDPDEWNKYPEEQEKITAVSFRRVPIEGNLADATESQAQGPRGRWVLVDRIAAVPVGGDGVGELAQLPSGDLVGPIRGRISRSSDGGRTWREVVDAKFPGQLAVFSVLRSGRWLVGSLETDETIAKPDGAGTVEMTQMEMRGGYPIYKVRGHFYNYSVFVSYSDDNGKTWHKGKPFKGPLKWAFTSTGHVIERPDGELWLPLYGCVTDEEVDSYSSSNCIVRSRDEGKTWGDPSFVFRTNPKGPDDFQAEPRYSEMDIVQLPSGSLLAFSRCESYGQGGGGTGATEAAVSVDNGRSWRKTGASLSGVSQQTGLALPDGGVALAYRSHSWQQPGVAVSYDEGRSFSYLLGGPYDTSCAFVTAKDEFVFFTEGSRRSDGSAGVYRFVPNLGD